MNPEHLRHSLAHLLAAAVLELYPDTKRAIGPAIENGFYYDLELPKPISDEDLPKIEEKMREILKTWTTFSHKEVSADEARKIFKDNPYKLELIDEFSEKGDKLTIYTSGSYDDLCRGGHVENAKEIDPKAFKLTHLAGAYWRGSEKNKMLTRIYGLAFATPKELEDHVAMLEEAKKRDHKKLGPELDLFVFSELVGSGLPLWTPKGTLVRNLLDSFVWELRKARGYVQVDIPHITKKDLYETSGHWEKFKDELLKITTREGHVFAMKPMNCPHHTQIYARRPWSYRELPQRYASTTKVYRDEQSGELAGLSRVRAITQDDAHVFCRHSQVKDEIFKVWDIISEFYGAFGFELSIRLSLHDPEHFEKYLGTPELWKNAEDKLRELVKERGVKATEAVGEAALYGPKIDFLGKDAIGRLHQIATIQLDMNLPERFDLTCVNEKGEKERIVMIHCAIMGSIERFLSVAIEHFAGAFPVWLAPVQVAILPVSDKVNEYAGNVLKQLSNLGIRVELHDQNESIGKKIRNAEMQKIPYLLVVGEKEAAAEGVAVRQRGKGDLGVQKLGDFISQLEKEIKTKQL
ncbi:MAG: threonine--tRNA ligase [Patescibacteria group bacterium]